MKELSANTVETLHRAGQHAERKGPDTWVIAGNPEGRIIGVFMHGCTISSTTKFPLISELKAP